MTETRKKDAARDETCDDFDAHAAWAAKTWPEIDPVVEQIVNRIDKIGRYIDRASVDTLDSLGLALGELKVLLCVNKDDLRSPAEIAKHLLVSTGTMTNRLDKLEAAGLVARTRDPHDRRSLTVELTEAGRRTLDSYVSVQAKRERQLLSGLDDADKGELTRLLRLLLASVQAQAGFVLHGKV
ncbi:MAG: MarR family transcriptional regulator [Acidimicrobiales bacterium]